MKYCNKIAKTYKFILLNRVLKVYSATYQVVSGSLYKIIADIEVAGETKENCEVQIIEQSWLEKNNKDGGRTTINCPNSPEKLFTHKVAQ